MARRLIIGIFAAVLMWPFTSNALEDVRDLGAMLETLNDVLNVGRSNLSMEYVSTQTGNRGRVEAVRPAGNNAGQPCWIFRRSYGKPGVMKSVDGRACRTPDGLWEIVDEGTGAAGTLTTSPGTSSATAVAPTTTVAPGPRQNRELVYETQELLTLLGYDPGPIDGLYGRRTGAAISAYQRDSNLLIDGQPSPQLRDHLRNAAENRSSSTAPAPTAPAATVQQPAVVATAPSAPVQQAATPPSSNAAGGEVAVTALAKDGASFVGRNVTATGTYLHYNGNWAKLLSEEGSSSNFVYILLDGLNETQRTTLRNDCFLCHIRTSGQMQMRELEFAGSSLGAVPTIVVTELVRLD